MSTKRGWSYAVSVGTCLAVAALATAESVVVCCKYLYTWPSDPALQGPEGPCSGTVAYVCEDGSTSAGYTDPLRLFHGQTLRYARCYLYNLGAGQSFVRTSCEAPPAGALLVGSLGNGMCCYIVGPTKPVPMLSLRTFQLADCAGACNDPSSQD